MEALTPEHWDYMDRFSDRLVARGPTLSEDGEEHTGSVHVVSLEDGAASRRFADAEPYQRAGLFASTSIDRFVNLLGCTMWDRPRAPHVERSALVLTRWPAVSTDDRLAQAVNPDDWAFLGLLVTDDGTASTGLVGAVDADATGAERAFRALLAALHQPHVPIELHRWERGGRL